MSDWLVTLSPSTPRIDSGVSMFASARLTQRTLEWYKYFQGTSAPQTHKEFSEAKQVFPSLERRLEMSNGLETGFLRCNQK